MACPPCTNRCQQGKSCPARNDAPLITPEGAALLCALLWLFAMASVLALAFFLTY